MRIEPQSTHKAATGFKMIAAFRRELLILRLGIGAGAAEETPRTACSSSP
jgi:hypothetical protein